MKCYNKFEDLPNKKRYGIIFNENKEKLVLVDLPYQFKDLKPIMDADTVKYHYDVLSRGYVDRFNSGEGDPEFNRAGALLHNVWWPQLDKQKISNRPTGNSLAFIEKHFSSFDDFKEEFNDIANKLQGSGWCYLAKDGKIKTLMLEVKPKHQTKEPVKKKRITKQYITEVATWGVNQSKWKAAKEFCLDRGWEFQIITEDHLGL